MDCQGNSAMVLPTPALPQRIGYESMHRGRASAVELQCHAATASTLTLTLQLVPLCFFHSFAAPQNVVVCGPCRPAYADMYAGHQYVGIVMPDAGGQVSIELGREEVVPVKLFAWWIYHIYHIYHTTMPPLLTGDYSACNHAEKPQR